MFTTKYILRLCSLAMMTMCCLCINTSLANENSSKSSQQKIDIEITTHLGDEQNFKDGDIVSFFVSLNRDAYLLLIYQDAGNNLYLLLPNSMYKNNYYKAGLFIPIPNENNPFQFRIGPPYGKDTLWAFASNKPFPQLIATPEGSDIQKLKRKIGGIRKIITAFSQQQNALVTETSLHLLTSAKN